MEKRNEYMVAKINKDYFAKPAAFREFTDQKVFRASLEKAVGEELQQGRGSQSGD